MLVSLDGSGALARQLYRALRGAILGGVLPPGARLPSSRALASEVGVSRNTVLLAYAQLLDEGYVTGRRGSGTYVPSELPDAMTAVAPEARRRTDGPAREPRLSQAAQRVGTRLVTWAPRPERVPYDFRYGRPAF